MIKVTNWAWQKPQSPRKSLFVPLIMPWLFVFVAFVLRDMFWKRSFATRTWVQLCQAVRAQPAIDLMRYDTFLFRVGVGVIEMFLSTPLSVVQRIEECQFKSAPSTLRRARLFTLILSWGTHEDLYWGSPRWGARRLLVGRKLLQPCSAHIHWLAKTVKVCRVEHRPEPEASEKLSSSASTKMESFPVTTEGVAFLLPPSSSTWGWLLLHGPPLDLLMWQTSCIFC